MTYQSDWSSLREHPTPRWFRDSKFGIYTHWGVYSVPAWGKNGTWYPYFMHQEGTPHHEHQVSTYGQALRGGNRRDHHGGGRPAAQVEAHPGLGGDPATRETPLRQRLRLQD